MGVVRILSIALFAILFSGCVTHTASPAVQGRAYVATGSAFGTKMLNCDARSGVPECWHVQEIERPGKE